MNVVSFSLPPYYSPDRCVIILFNHWLNLLYFRPALFNLWLSLLYSSPAGYLWWPRSFFANDLRWPCFLHLRQTSWRNRHLLAVCPLFPQQLHKSFVKLTLWTSVGSDVGTPCCWSRTAISAAVAISTALCRLRTFSASTFLWVLLLVIPHTRRSLSACSRKLPKLQVRANRRNSIKNSLIGSPGCWSHLWKTKRSAITGGFGLKCRISSSVICARVHLDGFCGATRFFNAVYVFTPKPLNKCGTRCTLFTAKKNSNCSK